MKTPEEIIDILESHILRVTEARRAFHEDQKDPSKRVDSRRADDADYALCSFVERHGPKLLSALRESSKVVPEGGEVARLRKQVTTLARVEGELRKTIAFARQALLTARDAMKREAWQEGPTIGNAERALGEMIDVIKHEITVEHAEHQLKWAAQKASDAIRERNVYLHALQRITTDFQPGPGQDALALSEIRACASAALSSQGKAQ